MASPPKPLTEPVRFFLEPEQPRHRQYEALRAYFAEGMPPAEAARHFGYTPGAFRVLCHAFRHGHRDFFTEGRPGPQVCADGLLGQATFACGHADHGDERRGGQGAEGTLVAGR